MSTGVRATVRFSDPGSCPLARLSAHAATPVGDVSNSVSPPGSETVTDAIVAAEDLPADLADDAIFSYGEADLHRVVHGNGERCPCGLLGEYGVPVHRYAAEDGELTLVFHVESFERLQEVVADLRERFPPLDVRRLLQPPLEGTPDQRAFVNLGRLTARQREVLQAAYERGYFERPKGANATEVAAALDISQSTFTEHLNAAQRKLLGDVFHDEG